MKKIAYFSNTDFSLYNFRLKLMQEMKKLNFKVYACSPRETPYFYEKLEKEFVFKETPLKRSIDLLGGDLLYFLRIFWFCRKEKPDICHNFTIKPCIYATLAQKLAGVEKIYCTITGLGYVFEKEGFLKKIVVFLYKIAAKKTEKITFQNPDDRDLFISLGIIPKEKTKLIKSSGVDLEYFSKDKIKKEEKEKIIKEFNLENKIVITLIGRMLYQKGVADFARAAEIIKKKAVDTRCQQQKNVEFLLVGPLDLENPSGVPEEKIKEWDSKGFVKYVGERRDIRELLSVSDVFTLPANSGEGVPKILLEAGSMELSLVTTDVSGCREVVKDSVNGFVIQPNNSELLAEKIEQLINNEEKRKIFGKKSRELVKKEFSDKKVVKETINMYNLLKL
ncbi:MAG: glycosyltransferase family 4 protein [Patescibacteria group bacterium]|nr:glycosyltransferase family 4 protein [Patescibacteria group bacterium]